MRNSPSDSMLSRVFFYKGMSGHGDLLRRVQQSWESVVRKGEKELSAKASDTTFNQWLKEKLQKTKSLSKGALSPEEEIPEPHVPTCEELNEAKSALAKVEEEKKALQAKVEEMALEKRKLEEENAEKTIAVKESMKRFQEEKKSKLEAQRYLKGAKEELLRYKKKTREALEEAQEWKSIAIESGRESHLVTELRDQMRNLEKDRDALDGIIRDYQQALVSERRMSDELKMNFHCLEEAYRRVRTESQHWHERFMHLIGRVEEHEFVKELRDEIQMWKNKFLKLSELASQAMVGVPKKLRSAEFEMHSFNTPLEVYQFVKYCRALITELKEQSPGASASKKRKQVGEFKAICI